MGDGYSNDTSTCTYIDEGGVVFSVFDDAVNDRLLIYVLSKYN
jgi:hypothetical protein